MGRNRNQCPQCSAQIRSNYRFCLACGLELDPADLPDPEPEPTPESKPHKRSRGRKPEPEQPVIGTSYSYAEVAAMPMPDTSHSDPAKKRSGGHLRLLLVLLVVVAGAVGGMMYWNEHPSSASDHISWTAVRELDFANIWIDTDAAVEASLRQSVPAEAVKARANGVADDGMVSVKLQGQNVVVRLAGVPETFTAQCLGDKAINRLNRVLPNGAVVYVLVDGDGPQQLDSAEAPPAVYLWMIDLDAGRVRFANQELISSGEAEFAGVTLSDSDVGQSLQQSSERAQSKQRGRYQTGACS